VADPGSVDISLSDLEGSANHALGSAKTWLAAKQWHVGDIALAISHHSGREEVRFMAELITMAVFVDIGLVAAKTAD
jgi:hypothetical protein